MSVMEFVPKHGSHSAISNYLWCGKKYELTKIRGALEAPAWWLIGGSAVHAATEWWDREEWDEDPGMAFQTAFHQGIKDAEEQWPDRSTWLSAGYGARAQGYHHWLINGPHYLEQWARRRQDFYSIELDVSTVLPSGARVKAFIDRVQWFPFENRFHLIDMKTSARRPESDQQLGMYAALFRQWFAKHSNSDVSGLVDVTAAVYMFKDDAFYPVDVSAYSIDTVDRLVNTWMEGVKHRIFLPNRGAHCRQCSVADACFLQSGDTPTTRRTDPYNPLFVEP